MSETTDEDPVDSSIGFVVTVPYVQNNVPVDGTYAQVLRMGGWATAEESLIVNSSGEPLTTTTNGKTTNTSFTGSDPLQDKGILIYSADQYTVYAPQIRSVGMTSASSWANETMTITTKNDRVATYSYAGPLGFTANYQKLDAITMTEGSSNTFTLGETLSVWSGDNASTGIGGSLSSTFGLSQSISAGQAVTINGSDISVQGIGVTTFNQKAETLATKSIDLTVTPLAESSADVLKVANFMREVATYGGLLAGGVAPVALDITALTTTNDMSVAEDKIKLSARIEFDTAMLISGLVIVGQAMAAMTGLLVTGAARGLERAAPGGNLSLGLAESRLGHGPGVSVRLGDGIVSTKGDIIELVAGGSIQLSLGGARIIMDDAGIEISLGPNANIIVTPEGVSITGLKNNVK